LHELQKEKFTDGGGCMQFGKINQKERINGQANATKTNVNINTIRIILFRQQIRASNHNNNTTTIQQQYKVFIIG
jgi:hypothetical protein